MVTEERLCRGRTRAAVLVGHGSADSSLPSCLGCGALGGRDGLSDVMRRAARALGIAVAAQSAEPGTGIGSSYGPRAHRGGARGMASRGCSVKMACSVPGRRIDTQRDAQAMSLDSTRTLGLCWRVPFSISEAHGGRLSLILSDTFAVTPFALAYAWTTSERSRQRRTLYGSFHTRSRCAIEIVGTWVADRSACRSVARSIGRWNQVSCRGGVCHCLSNTRNPGGVELTSASSKSRG